MTINIAYILLALCSFLCALLTVPIALVFGRRFGFMDQPGERKIHSTAIIRCGGVGIWLAFFVSFVGVLLALPYVQDMDLFPSSLKVYIANVGLMMPKIAALLFGACVAFATGLWDDKKSLSPRVKLFWQLVAIVPLPFVGITANCFLGSAVLSGILTIFWVLLITNAFNLLDNMNGLSAGVALIACFCFYLISSASDEWFMMAMFAIFAGSIAGFLPYNFPKAKLFMGDSGSLFIGYMLGTLSVLVSYYKVALPTALPVLSPLIILAVPLYDTLSVMWIRYRAGQPLMKGDRNHISHRLEALGFSRTGAVVMVWALSLAVGVGAVNLRSLALPGALIAVSQIVLWFVIFHIVERHANARIRSRE